MPLTDLAVRRARPAAKGYRITDGGGLHLFVSPSGGKLWRWRYERAGKEQLLSLGSYPDVGLSDARAARDEARRTLKTGGDPAAVKRSGKARAAREDAETFEVLAREWLALQRPAWSEHHAWDVMNSLEKEVFPAIGDRGVRQITSPDVLDIVRRIEKRGAIETARRVRQRISAVFGMAMATARADIDPAAPIKGVLAPLRKGRQPAVTELAKAREVLATADASPASPVTKLGLRLLALTVVRPGTMVSTPWGEFEGLDPTEPTWRIPAARMKLRTYHKDDEARDHLVPLSRQAVEVIEALRVLTGRALYVLPSVRSAHKPMSNNAIGYLLNRAGYHGRHVPHGWRASFSTLMNERHPADRAIIDLMLAHLPKEKVEAAYNRAAHLRRRRELAQDWADLLCADLGPPMDLLRGPRSGRDRI